MNQLKWYLLAAYAFGCVVLYPKLPDRIPYHFNFSGEPNAWGGTFVAWFGLPLIALFMVVLLTAIMKLPVSPQLWNVPEKQRFLALSAEQRAPIFREIRKLMDGAAIGTVLLFAAIQYGVYAVGTGRLQKLPLIVGVAAVTFVLAILIGAFTLNARIKRHILSATDQP